MKTKFVTICFAIATVLAPVAAYAADGDSDRTHPVEFVKDLAITVKVKAKLADQKVSSLMHIQVDTDAKGAVSLSGTVNSQEEADMAVKIAAGTEGVTSVTSNLGQAARIGNRFRTSRFFADRKSAQTNPVRHVMSWRSLAVVAAGLAVFAAEATPQMIVRAAYATECTSEDRIDGSSAVMAKVKMEEAGFRQVSGLTKGCDNFWHGRATKDGADVGVVLSPHGEVMTEGN